MRTKNLVFSVFTLLLFVSYANAQVTGVVADDFGPVAGALVTVEESGISTETNEDGAFSIDAVIGNSLIIMNPETLAEKTYPIAKLNMGKLVITDATVALDDVISVAYGTADKTTFTGAVSSIGEDQLEKMKSSDVAKSLEGAVSGVSIVSPSGQPGSAATILIRGVGSINASQEPLIVLDGAPYYGDINSINPFDVKSINVLKDAASAALYGARGANGVIIITTKKGEKGRLSVNFDMSLGVNERGVPEYDIITSPSEYYETFWEALYNKGLYTDNLSDEAARKFASNKLYENLGYNIYNVGNNEIVGLDGKINPNAKIKYEDANDFNDWAGRLFAPQLRKEYNLGLSQKTNKGNVSFSLGYVSDDGYNQNSYFERYSNRLSFDTALTDWLDLTTSSLLSYTTSNWTTEGGAYSNPFQWTRSIAPIFPVFVHDADGNLVRDKYGNPLYDFGDARPGINGGRGYGAKTNPLATQNEDLRLNQDYYLTQNANLNVKLMDNLTLSLGGSFSGNWLDFKNFITPSGGSGQQYNGIIRKTNRTTYSLNLNQILRYSNDFGDVGFSALLGHESYGRRINNMFGEKRDLLDPANTEFNNAVQMAGLNSFRVKYSVEGYFGQVTTDYLDRYFISASARRDGSSVFHPDNRWGTFWSAGASWRVDREDFMRGLSAIDLFKLKSSYGVQGSDHLFLPNGRRSWTPYQTLYSITSNGGVVGIQAAFKGRKEVTWEESINFNAGFELSLYKGLLDLEVDFFSRRANDLLFNLPLSATEGFESEPWNVADMENKGIEASVSSLIINTDKVKWSLNANGTSYKNTILRMPQVLLDANGGFYRNTQRLAVGGGIYDFYMVKWAGVDSKTGEALYWIKNKDTGVFEKTKGKDYYVVDEKHDNRQYVGTALPDLAGGFGTTLDAYGFDLTLQFSYQLGGKMLDGEYSGLMRSTVTNANNWHTDIRNRWTPDNKGSDIPRLEFGNQDFAKASDRFLIDASYVALRNVSLGYNFDKNVINTLRLEGLRIYVTATNAFLWSQRKGLDPRVSLRGFNNTSRYSPIRTITGGVTIKL